MAFLLPGITITDDNVHVDFESMIAAANTAVLRATVFMGFGLNAAAEPSLTNFHPQEAYLRLLPSELTHAQVQQYKYAFSDWVVQNALRELVENFGQFLNGIYAAAVLFENGAQPITHDLMKQIKVFAQKGEKKRIDLLARKFGFDVPHLSYIDSLVDIRNEITHAWGIVRQPALKLRWLRQQVALRSDDGKDIDLKLPLGDPVHVESNSSLIIKFVEAEKSFVRGERIILSPIEAQEIFLSTQYAIPKLANAVVAKWGQNATKKSA